MCEVTGLHLEFYQRDVTDGFRSQEVVKFAQKPENAVQPVIGLVYAHLHGGRRPLCVVGLHGTRSGSEEHSRRNAR